MRISVGESPPNDPISTSQMTRGTHSIAAITPIFGRHITAASRPEPTVTSATAPGVAR